MDRIKKIIKQNRLNVFLIAVIIILSIPTTYAIYTRITIAKRVVSTQAGAGNLFSSNCMSEGGTKTVETSSDTTADVELTVYVYNYAFPKVAVYRTENTEYDLTATIGTLGDGDVFTPLTDTDKLTALGTQNYSITYNGTTNDTFNFGGSNGASHKFEGCNITGGSANSEQFTVVMDKNELGNNPNGYCIRIVAEPYNSDLPTITGYILASYSKPSSVGWSGEVEELDATIIDDYDGYNYYLEGNGKGKITFRWNRNKLTINKQFLENTDNKFYYWDATEEDYVKFSEAPSELALTADGDMVSLTLEVDSTEQNRYEIQFYKVDPTYDYSKAAVEGYLPNTRSSDWHPDD
ncbi:MAG: hypothetical protein IJM32_10920 [Ruminococcus sp.]|nr:hypothetical protein [Ruminococcus sp.]